MKMPEYHVPGMRKSNIKYAFTRNQQHNIYIYPLGYIKHHHHLVLFFNIENKHKIIYINHVPSNHNHTDKC